MRPNGANALPPAPGSASTRVIGGNHRAQSPALDHTHTHTHTHTHNRTAELSATQPPPGLRPLIAMRIGDPERYAIIGEHGRGGLGCVSRAHDRELGRDVAIKELISRGPVSELRFMREALITARLEHPGIVPVHEAGRWPDGTPYYAMKLVAGCPLRDLLAERHPMEQRMGLLHHIIAVADAIAYAHDRHIIHRDLKPANVIVGEFGETVVIDWGLAKDLSGPDDAGAGPAPLPLHSDPGLTTTGNVLGTPAYMAPEQERGEHVDQRADVFAIGAMLWELCSREKLPGDRPLRHRMLRRAGVDRDLVVIIEKAIEPDPARRYPDAGALAADLKAFKSGARIAARSYSLVAMLGHWARRHRALACAVVAAVAVAISATTLHVRTIATERDRAETSNSRLILGQVELLLHTDPSAASDLLDTYHGDDAQRMSMLRAKARGLGLARVRAQPHTQDLFFAHPLADGSVLTVGMDGTVARTAPDGRTRVIARGVAPQYTYAYSEAHHWMAYACNATAICILDLERETLRAPPPGHPSLAPTCLGFSPDQHLFASLTPRGELSVWMIADDGALTLRSHHQFANGESIRFVDDDSIAVETSFGIHVVHLPVPGRAASVGISIDGLDHITTNNRLHLLAAATSDGSLVLFDVRTDTQILSHPICRGAVNRILLLPEPLKAVYACQDGDTGVLDVRERKVSVLTHMDGGGASLAATADGRMLVLGGANGQLAIYDVQAQMLSPRLGHTTRITVLVAPTPAYPYILSGDASGALRVWSPPDSPVRVATRTATRMLHAAPLAHDGPVIAYALDSTIPWSAADGRSGQLDGHFFLHYRLALSPTQAQFALYDSDDDIELWSLEAGSTHRTLHSEHGAVTAAAFVSGGELVVGHRDGTITRWSSDGAHRDLGSIGDAVDVAQPVPGSDSAVIAGASGALWLAQPAGLVELASQTEPITSLACARDGRLLAVGTARGTVQLYDLVTRQLAATFSAASWVELVEFSADGKSIAISSNGRMRIAPIDGTDGGIELRARHVSFSPDHRWFAAIGDQGDVWFHHVDGRWVYLATGIAKIPFATFSDNGAHFVATDPAGRALLVDMQSAVFQ